MEEINQSQEIRIAVYKWIKIIQAVLMMVLGGSLILIAGMRINDGGETSAQTVSYCIGVAFSAYGIINVISGYMLERTPMSKEVIMGIIFASIGVSLIIKPNFLLEIFPMLLIVAFYGFAAIFAVYGFDKIIGKEVKKSYTQAVLLFILSLLMIAAATTYIFYYKDKGILNYVLVALGVLLLVLGIILIVLLCIRIHNTNKMIKEKEIKQKQMDAMLKEEEKETKIIDISELRKKNGSGKKIHNRQTTEIEVEPTIHSIEKVDDNRNTKEIPVLPKPEEPKEEEKPVVEEKPAEEGKPAEVETTTPEAPMHNRSTKKRRR